MNKEQTPIEQILKTTLVIDNPKGIKYAVEKLEAHFNAKVLEALEREVPKAFEVNEIEYCNLTMKDDCNKKIHLSRFNQKTKDYYETEVKPKYNKNGTIRPSQSIRSKEQRRCEDL